jgi:glycosyltransferase involved in cell wall biosynthesis
VLHIIETLGHGGAEHQLAVVARSLDRSRFESIVCHLYPPDHLASRIRIGGSEVRGLGLKRSKLNWPRAIARVRGLIRELRIDLVHTSLFEADLVGGTAARLAGVPCVNTLCNMGGEPERLIDNERNSLLKMHAHTRLWGTSMRLCQRHSIAISNAVLESAARTYGLPRERMSVIYRAYLPREAPSPESVERVRRELGLEARSPILLNIGRLAPQKGQKYLIRAMAEISRALPSAMSLIAGEGWMRDELEREVASAGVAGHVRFLGRREDTPVLFELADAFVFPSLFEGLGVSLIEAAGAGRPAIASNVGPIPEVVEDGVTGLLVPPRDPAALARAIVRLAEDRAAARAMGEAARAKVAKELTVGEMVKRLEAVYDHLLR